MEIEMYRMHLLRGPLLICVAATSIIAPYLLRWTPTFVLQLAILGLGFLCCCHDFISILERNARRELQRLFDKVVLDDVLRAVYDPETGLVACVVGSFIGVQTMYALRLDAEQRTKLVQSSLWVSNEEARSILHGPGGCKTLLPGAVQTWLSRDAAIENTTTTSAHVDEDDGQESDSSETECKSIPDEAKDPCTEEFKSTSRGFSCDTEQSASDNKLRSEQSERDPERRDAEVIPNQDPPGGIGDDPVTVMFSIVSEIVYAKIKQQAVTVSRSISPTQAENVAVTASLALAAQLLLRRRSSSNFLGSLCAFVLSGTAVTAFSGLFAREIALGNVHDKESAQIMLQAAAVRVLERLKAMAREKLQFKRILAVAVLILVGRKGSRRSKHPLQHPMRNQNQSY
jgi:hypothetical protein